MVVEGVSLAHRAAPASVLIGMELDQWRLPVGVDVDRSLHQRRDPSRFSAEAMNGYWVAFWRREAATQSASTDFDAQAPDKDKWDPR